MDANPLVELEGQTSINDLLDEPVGTIPVQPALPIPLLHAPKASARRAPGASE